TAVAIAVQPKWGDRSCTFERAPHAVERLIDDAMPHVTKIRWQKIMPEQIVARSDAEIVDDERRPRLERLHRADAVDSRNVASDTHERFAAIEVRRASAAALVYRKAEAREFVERRGGELHRGHRRNFPLDQLRDECMLFINLRVGPARGTIELDDHRWRVVSPYLIDAILEAVEREQTAVAANADAVERVENAVGRQTIIRRGIASVHLRILRRDLRKGALSTNRTRGHAPAIVWPPIRIILRIAMPSA